MIAQARPRSAVDRLAAEVDNRTHQLTIRAFELARLIEEAEAATSTVAVAVASATLPDAMATRRALMARAEHLRAKQGAYARAEAGLARTCRALLRAATNGLPLPPYPHGAPRSRDEVRALVAHLEGHQRDRRGN